MQRKNIADNFPALLDILLSLGNVLHPTDGETKFGGDGHIRNQRQRQIDHAEISLADDAHNVRDGDQVGNIGDGLVGTIIEKIKD